MPDTPCGICGKSGNDQDGCVQCSALAFAVILRDRFGGNAAAVKNATFETFLAQPDDQPGKWRAYAFLTFDNGRFITYSTEDTFDKLEDASKAADELTEDFRAWVRSTGGDVVDSPIAGRNLN
jgi:hypothetical protein